MKTSSVIPQISNSVYPVLTQDTADVTGSYTFTPIMLRNGTNWEIEVDQKLDNDHILQLCTNGLAQEVLEVICVATSYHQYFNPKSTISIPTDLLAESVSFRCLIITVDEIQQYSNSGDWFSGGSSITVPPHTIIASTIPQYVSLGISPRDSYFHTKHTADDMVSFVVEDHAIVCHLPLGTSTNQEARHKSWMMLACIYLLEYAKEQHKKNDSYPQWIDNCFIDIIKSKMPDYDVDADTSTIMRAAQILLNSPFASKPAINEQQTSS